MLSTNRTFRQVAAAALALSLVAVGCGSDDGSSADPSTASTTTVASGGSELAEEDALAAATTYADVVAAAYRDTADAATELQVAIAELVAEPSDATLAAAKDQWLAARDLYGPTEAFRFYDGPIDDPEDGPEGQINAWPMDEAYVDYVEGDGAAGIINDTTGVPEITRDVILAANEEGGETNISTGWHAIEFLLWGQDLNEGGPGTRPVTDYSTAPTADASRHLPHPRRRAAGRRTSPAWPSSGTPTAASTGPSSCRTPTRR